jgi:hypothetical protein
MQTLHDRIRRFVRGLDASLPDSCPRQLWTKARAELQALADHLEQAGPTPVDANAALSAYLERNADASEDEALKAVNAAGARLTLDGPRGLRRNPLWRRHAERRIAAYMDQNPDAPVDRIAVNIGVAPATVHKSRAYQDRKEARENRRRKKREEKKAAKAARKQWKTYQHIAWLEAGDYVHKNEYFADPEALRQHLLNAIEFQIEVEEQGHSRKGGVKSQPGFAQFVRGLSREQLEFLIASNRTGRKDEIAPEEEEAYWRNLKRRAQRRKDNSD